MAVDAFIKIDGVEGESSDKDHQGWIEVVSYETETNQRVSTTASSAGGASAGRADFSDFIFTKLVDKATPLLAAACAEGKHLDKIIVEFCRAGEEKVRFLQYKLSNSLISRIASAGGGGAFPSEIVHLNFGRIEWIYFQQSRAGGCAKGQISAGWNLEKNCRI